MRSEGFFSRSEHNIFCQLPLYKIWTRPGGHAAAACAYGGYQYLCSVILQTNAHYMFDICKTLCRCAVKSHTQLHTMQ